MHSQPRAEHGASYCSASDRSFRFSEPLARNIEEFFNHRVAYDSLRSAV